MGFWSSLGKGLGAGLGVGLGLGTGLGVTNAAFGAIFGGGGCFGDYGYRSHQFSRMDAYLQGRFDQAYVDRMQFSALAYGRGCWC